MIKVHGSYGSTAPVRCASTMYTTWDPISSELLWCNSGLSYKDEVKHWVILGWHLQRTNTTAIYGEWNKPLPQYWEGSAQQSTQHHSTDCCSISLFHINRGVQSYRHTAIPHCMAVVLRTQLWSTLCKSTILWTHPCSTLQRSTVSWTHPCFTLCTVVLWKHPCSMFHTVEESRLTNGTMLHTMKEYNLMDKHQVPHYVAVKSYGQTPSENCILHTKKV